MRNRFASDQAVGMIMAAHRVDAGVAESRLKDAAERAGIPEADLAHVLVKTGQLRRRDERPRAGHQVERLMSITQKRFRHRDLPDDEVGIVRVLPIDLLSTKRQETFNLAPLHLVVRP